MLQIANAAVNHLEAFGGGAAAEIALFDQGDPQSAQCRIPGGGGTERPAADDQHIELLGRQCLEVAPHVGGPGGATTDSIARPATSSEPAMDK